MLPCVFSDSRDFAIRVAVQGCACSCSIISIHNHLHCIDHIKNKFYNVESYVTHKHNADDRALSPSKHKKVGSVTAVKPMPQHLFRRRTLAPVILIGSEHNKDSDIFIPCLNNSIKNKAP